MEVVVTTLEDINVVVIATEAMEIIMEAVVLEVAVELVVMLQNVRFVVEEVTLPLIAGIDLMRIFKR